MKTSIAIAAVLAGCADDTQPADPYACMAAGGAACFELPTKPIAAVDSLGKPAQPSLECGPYEVRTSVAPVTLAGTTINALDGEAVPLVHVEAFADLATTSLLGDTISDELGAYSLTIPAMPSQLFARTIATGALPLYFLYARTDVDAAQQRMFALVTGSRANLASTLELVGDRFLPGRSQVTAVAYDCNGNRLVNVIGNIAPSSAAAGDREHEPGVRTYYTIDRSSPALGRRTQLMETTVAGSFVASNVTSGRHYVQAWAFPAESALAKGDEGLVLIGEAELAVPSTEAGLYVQLHSRLP